MRSFEYGNIHLFIFCDIIDQLFGVLPGQTGICDGFSVYAAAYFLAALFDITFHHHALYECVNILVQLAAVHDFLDNADLLLMLFVRIAVVGIDNAGWIF